MVISVAFAVKSPTLVPVTNELAFVKEINITSVVIPFLMLFFIIVNHSS
ncbi:hypothetical protein [Clostridium lacusfryxellense]|nr:hypothetical protein [Clostridium lacusfryxellense]MBU3111076.1 hypothetical protein [Clostridium lacusfryxellense]